MSISSLLQDEPPKIRTPPISTNISFDTGYVARQVPVPELTISPVNDAALSVSASVAAGGDKGKGRDPEIYDVNRISAPDLTISPVNDAALSVIAAPATGRDKGKGRDPALYDVNRISAPGYTPSPVNDAALSITAAPTTGWDKGKGRDPALYDVNPTAVGITEPHQETRSDENVDAAQSLLRLLREDQDLHLYSRKDAGNTEEKKRCVYRRNGFETAKLLLRTRYGANAVDGMDVAVEEQDVEAAFGLVNMRYDVMNCEFDWGFDDDEESSSSSSSSSEDNEDGPPSTTTRDDNDDDNDKSPPRCIYSHGHSNHHDSATQQYQGNALYELLSSRFVHRGPEHLCWLCWLFEQEMRKRYQWGYRRLGMVGFERESTVEVEVDDEGDEGGEYCGEDGGGGDDDGDDGEFDVEEAGRLAMKVRLSVIASASEARAERVAERDVGLCRARRRGLRGGVGGRREGRVALV